MHVVYVIDNLGSGGAQRQLVEIARQVRSSTGWRVSCLVYRHDDFYGARLRESDVAVVELPRRRGLDPSLPLRMRAWLRAERADLVHAFMLNPSLWSLLALRGLPWARRPALVSSERDSVIGANPRQRFLQWLTYGRSDAVTANSALAVEAISLRLGLPHAHVRYVPNGIDLDAWDRAGRDPCPLALAPGRFHLALVGRLEPQKNHALLVEALRRIEPARRLGWEIWFVGAETGGRAFAQGIHERVRAAGLDEIVHFVPPLRGVAALMRELSLLVLPSKHEGFPNVALEAMASRLPVVASRVGDVPSLLEDGRTGFLFDSEDAGGLAAALLRASALAPSERDALVARARAAVEERYTIASIAAAYVRLYEAVRRERRPMDRVPAVPDRAAS